MLTRRRLLAGAAALAALPALPLRAAARDCYLGARWDEAAQQARVGAFHDDGAMLLDLALPARGHGLVARPGGAEVLVMGRRPGNFAAVLDVARAQVTRLVTPPAGRRFCGHGVFDPAGTLLFATESEQATGSGVIGVYDAAVGYRRRGEFSSGGLDPHDIRWVGGALVVANGGILTDPDAPGVKLNLHAMESNLARLDPRSGARLAQAALPPDLARLSLRHLAVLAGGRVAVAMQYEGPSIDRVPLAALWDGAGPLEPVDLPSGELRRLRQYCGSVAASPDGRRLALSSPRGHVALVWDVAARRPLGAIELPDGCGIAGDAAGGFVMSGGLGGARHWRADGSLRAVISDYVQRSGWDNHLIRHQVRL